MKLTIYCYLIDDRRGGPSIYAFFTEKERGMALTAHLRGIFENEGLGDMEDRGETHDQGLIEEALMNAGWSWATDERFIEVPDVWVTKLADEVFEFGESAHTDSSDSIPYVSRSFVHNMVQGWMTGIFNSETKS